MDLVVQLSTKHVVNIFSINAETLTARRYLRAIKSL